MIQVELTLSQLNGILDAVRFYKVKGIDELVSKMDHPELGVVKEPYQEFYEGLEDYILSQRRRILDESRPNI